MTQPYLAIINPRAGGGRCGRSVDRVLAELSARGVALEAARTTHPGHAIEIARQGYADGYRRFISIGGDGTAYEIINGVFPQPPGAERIRLAFLPLGTGNSFLRDFSKRGLEHATRALIDDRSRPCDVIRLTHAGGVIHYVNLLSVGFTADVATITNRRFKPFGPFGYLLGVLVCLARYKRSVFQLRLDGADEADSRRCLFLSFNNSKYTGGKMMIAPNADTADGLIEYVRWGEISRTGLLVRLHRLYDGSHLSHPAASRRGVRTVEFDLPGPVDLMVDGEVLHLHCRRLDVLPSAMDVVA